VQQDLVERARSGLHDYLIWLRDNGDASEGYANKRHERTQREIGHGRHRKRVRGDFAITPDIGQETVRARLGINVWEKRKINSWRSGGRLRPDGTLRCSPRPDKPWTLERVAAAAPEANEWDHLAALILLDGVVRRRFMDSLKNIREVVEGIADDRLTRALQDPEHSEKIRTLVRDEVGAMFGELLGALKRGAAPPAEDTPARSQRKCSKCGVLGHTAKTCTARGPVAEDKWACVHCSNLAGRPLSDPITHPVPPKEFHKDDPSYTEAP
jgi:hypothetical protein